MRKAFFSVLFSFILCAALAVQVQAKDFVLMASTIGPIDAGIVAALEDQFYGSPLFFPNSPEWQSLQAKR